MKKKNSVTYYEKQYHQKCFNGFFFKKCFIQNILVIFEILMKYVELENFCQCVYCSLKNNLLITKHEQASHYFILAVQNNIFKNKRSGYSSYFLGSRKKKKNSTYLIKSRVIVQFQNISCHKEPRIS